MSVSTKLRPVVARAYLASYAQLVRWRTRSRSGRRLLERVCIVAALGRRDGIAAGALLQCRMLRRLGVDAELVDATPALRNPLFRAPHSPGTTYILHSGGPQTPALLSAVLPHAAMAWRIAYWAWELPDPPLDWAGFDTLVDEVWTPSTFAQASLMQLTERPIAVVPHAVPVRTRRQRDWTKPFTVLVFGDSRSSLMRKNVAGAIDAFRTAFGGAPQARLLLKLGGAVEDTRDLEEMVGGAPNIVVHRNFLDAAELSDLYRSADVLLSLHRAEGFGLPMLEAMAHGLPVIATGWSGNLEFMDRASAILVPYRLVPVADPAGIYEGSVWAEPITAVAVMALRRLAEDRDYYERMSAAAHLAAVDAALPRLPPELVPDPGSAGRDGAAPPGLAAAMGEAS